MFMSEPVLRRRRSLRSLIPQIPILLTTWMSRTFIAIMHCVWATVTTLSLGIVIAVFALEIFAWL